MDTSFITKTTIVENVTLITILEVPNEISKIAYIFSEIAKNEINIDMINQSTAYGGKLSLSFTVDSSLLQSVLTVIADLKKTIPSIKTDVSSGNVKIIFYGETMREHSGVAAAVLEKLSLQNIGSKLITSSEVDISVLVNENELDQLSL